MAKQAATLLLVAAGVVLLAGIAVGRHALRGESDAAKNERILERLDPPAGTSLVMKRSGTSYESSDEDFRPPKKTGYYTDVEYQVPEGVTQRELVRTYDRQLRGWQKREEVIPCEDYAAGDVPENCKPLVLVEYTRGRARVSLNIDGYGGARPWGYELTVIQADA